MDKQENNKRKGFKSWYRRRRRILQFVFSIIFLSAIGITIQVLITQTDFFLTQHFEIYELNKSQFLFIDTRHLDSVVRDQITGTNYFDLNVNDLEKEIKKADRFIDDVFVEKVFPSGIIVELTERSPYIVYKDIDGCLLFDDQNTQIDRYEGKCKEIANEFYVPLLISTEEYEIFNEFEGTIRQFETMYKIISFLDSENIEINDISVEKAKSTFKDQAGRRYIFNHESDIGVQLKRCLLVMGQINFDKIDYKELDFRYERPVLRK